MTALRIEWIVFVLLMAVLELIWIALRDESTVGWCAIALLIVVCAGVGIWFAVDPAAAQPATTESGR